MEYDVVVVGAGPSGLAAACKLKQLNDSLSICVVEKGSEVGAHIISGAILEPRALNELFPDWQERGAPLHTAVSEDKILLCHSETSSTEIPHLFAPFTMKNSGNYIVSLGNLCRWLGEQAEALGVDIFPGFTAAEVLFDDSDAVKGIATGDMGVNASGEQKDSYTQGMELHGRFTLFAEGCRGHLGKQLIAKFGLAEGKDTQHYGIGIKELWKVPNEQHQPGLVVHSAGWPLSETDSTGGGFMYHLEDNQVAVGLITDLSYSNPHLSPFDEFQRYKHLPVIKERLQGGERLAYGARALVKGGVQSMPRMGFAGGALIGDNAGTLNFAKIKGTHTAMKSGMVVAEVVAAALSASPTDASGADTNAVPLDLGNAIEQAFKDSWAYRELHQQRNFGPAQHKWGNLLGSAYSFVDLNIFRGTLPWTLSDPTPDHATLKLASESKAPQYPKPDGVISFDKLSSVYLSNTNHEEDQPCHLQLKDAATPLTTNWQQYLEPAQRYCPAGVYEVIEKGGGEREFQINAQNCVHCKTCDIKDPAQNITWVTPEGGGGPNYPNM